MNKKNWIITIGVAIVFFALGFITKFFICMGTHTSSDENIVVEQEDVDTEEYFVRIREGYVEVYDGTSWIVTQSVSELQEADPYAQAMEGLALFEEEYEKKLNESNLVSVAEDMIVMGAPLIGEEQISGNGGGYTPSTNVNTDTPTPVTPSSPQTPSTTETPSTVETPSTTEAPSTTEVPSITEAPSATEAPEESGDGEDIGWSDDYL